MKNKQVCFSQAQNKIIFFHLIIISIIIFVVWNRVQNQTLWHDGYEMFNSQFRGIWRQANLFNIAGLMLYDLIIPIFRDNMSAYLLLQLIPLAVWTILIYFLTLRLTKSTLTAFGTAVIFSTNFGTVAEMLAEGNFNRVTDRMINFPLSLVAAFFLISCFRNKKFTYPILTFFFFYLGTYLGHYATFFLPFFIFYTLIYSFNKKCPLKSLLKGFLISAGFTVLNYLIIKDSNERSSFETAYYFNNAGTLLVKTIYFVTPMFYPRELFPFLGRLWHLPYPYLPITGVLSVVWLLFSAIAAIYFWKKKEKDKNSFKILLVCLSSILLSSFMMIYTDPIKFNPFKNPAVGHNHFVQSIFFSIAVTLLVSSLTKKLGRLSTLVFLTFVAIFAIYNTNLTWQFIDGTQYRYERVKKYSAYLKNLWPKFTPDTVVAGPTDIVSLGGFVNQYYGPPYVKFISAPEEIVKIKDLDRNKVYVLEYDYEIANGRYFKDRGRVVDLTRRYRSGEIKDLLEVSDQPGGKYY